MFKNKNLLRFKIEIVLSLPADSTNQKPSTNLTFIVQEIIHSNVRSVLVRYRLQVFLERNEYQLT